MWTRFYFIYKVHKYYWYTIKEIQIQIKYPNFYVYLKSGVTARRSQLSLYFF